MTNDEKQQLARKFLSVLGKPDEAVVKSVAVDDVIWTFPGSTAISGEARGAAAIIRARDGHRRTRGEGGDTARRLWL
ncbi:MAG: hypothetical protein WDM89_02780 [Rhizomicrobium sp.]